MNKVENVKSKKVAVFGTGASPIDKREQFMGIMRKNLEALGIKTIDNFLAINFKRGKIVDGEQNIDKYVNSLMKFKNE